MPALLLWCSGAIDEVKEGRLERTPRATVRIGLMTHTATQ